MRSVVVITTFDVESLAVAEFFDQPPAARAHREEHGTLYELGTFTGPSGPWQLTLAEVGPGNSNAGIELERARTAFSPDVILLVGVAGGLKDLALGDVVAAESVYDYESGKEAESGYLPRVKTHSSSHRLLQHARLVARQAEWAIAPATAAQPPRAVVKPIAAGGKLVANDRSRTVQHLRNHCGDAVAVEMEGYGFLRGAYLNAGLDVLVVRGISDLLSGKDQASDERWQPVAARNAAAFAFAVLDSLLRVTPAPDAATTPSTPARIELHHNQGIQIGDHNVQHNRFIE